jgi:hypothetical protein
MRLVVAAGLCILAASYLGLWPFVSTHTDALTPPGAHSIAVDIHFRYPDGEALILDDVLGTRTCVSFAELLTQSDLLRAQAASRFPDASGVTMVVVARSAGNFLKNVIYRSGDLSRKETAGQAKLIAAIQADACGLMGDTRSQVHWFEVMDDIEKLQNAGKRNTFRDTHENSEANAAL